MMTDEPVPVVIQSLDEYEAAVKRLSKMAEAPAGTVDEIEVEMLRAQIEAWQEAQGVEPNSIAQN